VGSEPPSYDGLQGPPPGRGELDGQIARLAARQHGVVSAAQLYALGLTARGIEARIRAKRLFRLHRGVYAVGHIALTSLSRDLAAVLACGPGALLSHRSAARLWGLLDSSSPRIEVTAPRTRKPRNGITVHRSRTIHPDDAAEVDGIPVTSVARTVVDLAEVVDEPRLARAVNQAEVRRLFDLDAVDAVLERLPGRRGAPRLQKVLAVYVPETRFTRSEAERRLLRLCAKHGLPAPQTTCWIGGYELDAYWPDARLAVEVDGRAFHATRRAFEEDRARDRRLAALGIQVSRVTWRNLDNEAGLAAELAAIRARRLGMG
jgi:very-short-patch-repair endonuclease